MEEVDKTRGIYLFPERYFLVFWPDEDAVTALSASKIVAPPLPEVGDLCRVKMGKRVYSGEAVAVGKTTNMLLDLYAHC